MYREYDCRLFFIIVLYVDWCIISYSPIFQSLIFPQWRYSVSVKNWQLVNSFKTILVIPYHLIFLISSYLYWLYQNLFCGRLIISVIFGSTFVQFTIVVLTWCNLTSYFLVFTYTLFFRGFHPGRTFFVFKYFCYWLNSTTWGILIII